RHVPRQARRDRHPGRGVRAAGPPLHPGPPVGRAGPRPAPGAGPQAHRPPRRRALPGKPSLGVPLPHPMLEGHRSLRRRGAGAGGPGSGPSRGLSPRRGHPGGV
ncbi:MAG: Oligopeptide transport ATP-binding protein OppF, partial [uncultured Acidimicrobiales bacterium]